MSVRQRDILKINKIIEFPGKRLEMLFWISQKQKWKDGFHPPSLQFHLFLFFPFISVEPSSLPGTHLLPQFLIPFLPLFHGYLKTGFACAEAPLIFRKCLNIFPEKYRMLKWQRMKKHPFIPLCLNKPPFICTIEGSFIFLVGMLVAWQEKHTALCLLVCDWVTGIINSVVSLPLGY